MAKSIKESSFPASLTRAKFQAPGVMEVGTDQAKEPVFGT
jgi:hypothetical protein